MANSLEPRRSGRSRKSNPRYTDQVVWTHDTLRLLRTDSNSPDPSSEISAIGSDQDIQDQDFDNTATQPPIDNGHEMTDDDESSDEAGLLQPATPDLDPLDLEIEDEKTDARPNWRPRAYHRPKTREWAKEKGLRSRMLQEGAVAEKLRGAKDKVYVENYGPQLEDLYPILRSRDIWHLNARNVVLPSRASIVEAVQLDLQGKYLHAQINKDEGVSMPHNDNEADLSDAKLDRANLQVLKTLTIGEAASRRYVENEIRNQVVLGPWDQSRKYEIGLLKPFFVTEAYLPPHDQPTTLSGQPTTPDQLAQPLRDVRDNEVGAHRGWLVNLGARPQCLAWANCEADTQYLAVTFAPSKAQRDLAGPRASKIAPAFSPSPEYPSHIQVLKVMAARGMQDHAAQLSPDQANSPHLHQLLCTNFGKIIRIEWLPRRPKNSQPVLNSTLVVLSSNGNIFLVETDLSTTCVQEVQRPRYLIQPPVHTVFTCFCLPSHEDLVAGDSAGVVHLFNLNTPPDTTNLEAYASFQIHHTYVMNVVVATDYPYFLCSSSAGGELILTDLRNPPQDQVKAHKSRLPSRNLAYYPFTRCFLTTTDAAGNSETTGTSMSTVVGHNLRHFYSTSTLLKLPECAGITTVLATSPFHPIVLVANASGNVFASNVIRRLLPGGWKGQGEGAATYMMKLYEVEWRELKVNEQNMRSLARTEAHDHVNEDVMDVDHQYSQNENNRNPQSTAKAPVLNATSDLGEEHDSATADPPPTEHEPIDLYHGPSIRPGVTRFHEGFRPEKVELGNFSNLKSKAKSKAGAATASSQIVLPEEQAVTAMAWNPNGRFSGWCAIGWGSGLAMIRDLAHDVV